MQLLSQVSASSSRNMNSFSSKLHAIEEARHTETAVLSNAVRSQWLKEVTRIVVKLGTGVLTDSRKQPDLAQMEQLVTQLAEQRKGGKEIVLVSSGAVGAGMGVLGFEKRPSQLAELQACAAVGQSRLMAIYEK